MQTAAKINVAVIGLGWVATSRHIPIILRHPQLHFFGVVDKRADRIQRLITKHPNLRSSVSNEGEMPWEDKIQAVLIATDPLNHYSLAKKMLLMKKHVLVEKPLTMTPQEGQELQEIATKTGVSFCVVHNFQFARSTLKLKEMLQKGQLGKIQSIEAWQLSNPFRRLPTWYEQLPFGLFYDESPHMFYMLEALAGQKIQHISSTILRNEGQNTPLYVTGHYVAGEVPIRLSMNFNASLSEWHIAVLGSDRVGIVDVFRDILVTLPNDRQHRAREILVSSSSSIFTHLRGVLTSGILLARGRLFYGADIVWDKFVSEINDKQVSHEISVTKGVRIVELQHEIMNESKSILLPTNENRHDK